MSRGAVLKSVNATKKFRQGSRDIYAVNGANMEIKGGDRVLIKGPSGAGKSTFLHMLGALLAPTGGRISVNGNDVYEMPDRKRSFTRSGVFGFVFQFFYLLPELSVMENVLLPALIRGGRPLKEIKTRAHDLLGQVNMSGRLNHRPGEISGGEAQRVSIARALINEPDFLFCDEPTGNLDSLLSAEISSLLISMSEEHSMGILVVSHNNMWENFFHKEFYMEDGFLSEKSREALAQEGKFIKG